MAIIVVRQAELCLHRAWVQQLPHRGVTQHAVLCARIKHYLCGMLFTGANEMWRNRGKLCPRKQISTAGGD